MDTATQIAAGKELGKMLDWCLKESYQPDGSFKTSELDDAGFSGGEFHARADCRENKVDRIE
jgi:hypothetical protein